MSPSASGHNKVHAVRGVSFSVGQGRMLRHRRRVRDRARPRCCARSAASSRNWEGEILIDGQPAPRHPDRAFCRTVQIVFQDPYGSLHPRQTVDRCLREPLEIQDIGERDQRIADTLQAVGLDQELSLPLSASALRRPAPARGHRARPDAGAEAAVPGRADLRPRRLGPGRDPQSPACGCARNADSPMSSSPTISRSSRICASG